MDSQCMLTEEALDESVRKIWAFMRVGSKQELEHHRAIPADAMLCLGSSDIRVASYAAQLFQSGVAKWLVFSGGIGTGPHSGRNLMGWELPEAEIFANEAVRLGVARDRILTEPRSTNTGENIKFCSKLLEERGITVNSLILVQKPFMERRTYATFMKQWPHESKPRMTVTSPWMDWPDYVADSQVSKTDIVSILVGDLQRLDLYSKPPTEFQIRQDIPDDVWDEYKKLVASGYTANLINRIT